jgi:hypothetical protein
VVPGTPRRLLIYLSKGKLLRSFLALARGFSPLPKWEGVKIPPWRDTCAA